MITHRFLCGDRACAVLQFNSMEDAAFDARRLFAGAFVTLVLRCTSRIFYIVVKRVRGLLISM